MTHQEARAVILREGHPSEGSLEGLWLDARDGVVPSRERMHQLLRALKVVFTSLRDADTLDRKLCAALWTLGCSVPQSFRAAAEHGRPSRPGFDDELLELEGRVSNVFEGLWQEWVAIQGIDDEPGAR